MYIYFPLPSCLFVSQPFNISFIVPSCMLDPQPYNISYPHLSGLLDPYICFVQPGHLWVSQPLNNLDQPHLLNKIYQINMGSNIFMESGVNIFVPYQIDIVM